MVSAPGIMSRWEAVGFGLGGVGGGVLRGCACAEVCLHLWHVMMRALSRVCLYFILFYLIFSYILFDYFFFVCGVPMSHTLGPMLHARAGTRPGRAREQLLRPALRLHLRLAARSAGRARTPVFGGKDWRPPLC